MEYPEKELTEKIIGAAIAVHTYWGPGLIESVYEKSLARELELQGVKQKRQVDLKLEYMRITACTVGLLLNFNKPTLTDGVKRFVL